MIFTEAFLIAIVGLVGTVIGVVGTITIKRTDRRVSLPQQIIDQLQEERSSDRLEREGLKGNVTALNQRMATVEMKNDLWRQQYWLMHDHIAQGNPPPPPGLLPGLP